MLFDVEIIRFRADPQDGKGFPRAFTVIYRPGDKIPHKVIIGGETRSDTRFFDINGDRSDELKLYDHSGNHYTTIMIYSFKNGDYECLFKNGTACYVHDVETDKRPVRIVIGRENWDDKGFCWGNSDTKSLLEVWEWNGSKFVYVPKLSTSPLTSEKEALEKAWQVGKKYIENTKGGKDFLASRPIKNHTMNEAAEFCYKAWIAGGRLEDFISDQ